MNQSATSVEFTVGSSGWYRALGFLTPTSARPIKTIVSLRPSGGNTAEVSVEAAANPGWYAWKVVYLVRRS